MRKLHLGCGSIKKEGYINIDFVDETPGVVDRIYDLRQPLDYDKDSVEIIESYHMFEHLPFSVIEQVVESWHECLKPGGQLILEMPDFDEVLAQLVNNPNDNTLLASVFGSQSREKGQFHHWGWNKTRLKLLLEGVGFKDVKFPQPQDYHKDLEPCLRVEAYKKE